MRSLRRWDEARARAAGATERHVASGLGYQWDRIEESFGPDADAEKVLTTDSIRAHVGRRMAAGASDSIRRELRALQRALNGREVRVSAKWPNHAGRSDRRRAGRAVPEALLGRWLARLPDDARQVALFVILTQVRSGTLGRITAAMLEPTEIKGAVAQLRVPATAHKTGEQVVPLTRPALEILAARMRAVPSGPLFPHDHKRALNTAGRAIGLRGASLRDLRKTGGTMIARRRGTVTARDALGHGNVSMTDAYLERDLGDVAAAQADLAASVVATAEWLQSPKPALGERVEGFEPSTLSLEGWEREAIEHLRACDRCRRRALACRVVHGGAGEVDTESGHTLARAVLG
jgi:integrase